MVLKTLRKKAKVLFTGGEDRGVSPVIGVILMVAITVILAAVIGAFVLGLGDDIGTNVQAGASVTDSPEDATLTTTYSSSQNADYLTLTVNGKAVYTNDEGQYGDDTLGGTNPTGLQLTDPGNSVTIDVISSGLVSDPGAGNSVEYGVVITAHNEDASTVVVDTTARANSQA